MQTINENITLSEPLKLRSGAELASAQIAWASYGSLNENKDNAILICHALTGDQFVAGTNPNTSKAGWWHRVVGPNLAIDTNKHFVICANVLAGCSGSTGPGSINPATGDRYGLKFPVITISDMADAQIRLLDYLGINKLVSVVGGSMGGMIALQIAAKYPHRTKSCVAIATAARHSPQNIAFHELGRQAIIADPSWLNGNYYDDAQPANGLAVARMAAHITYMSQGYLQDKFGRNLQDRDQISFGFGADFQVESYLRHQGFTFVDRFDANSYLYITRAMDYFDLAAEAASINGFRKNLSSDIKNESASNANVNAQTTHKNPSLSAVFKNTDVRFGVISFSSDWLFPTSESKVIVRALHAALADVSFVEIDFPSGHDSFLLDCSEMFDTLEAFISSSSNM